MTQAAAAVGECCFSLSFPQIRYRLPRIINSGELYDCLSKRGNHPAEDAQFRLAQEVLPAN